MKTTLFAKDYYRMTGKEWGGLKSYLKLITDYDIRYLYILRMKNGIIRSILMKIYAEKYGLEIHATSIGGGLFIGHAHNINVSPRAIIEKNCNLNKGCTIGKENRGKRNGAPSVGEKVWIGTNAVVVGAIRIGNDVLIAPNAYVNFDVPDHSIVIGNPGKIIPKDNATEEYIVNIV